MFIIQLLVITTRDQRSTHQWIVHEHFTFPSTVLLKWSLVKKENSIFNSFIFLHISCTWKEKCSFTFILWKKTYISKVHEDDNQQRIILILSMYFTGYYSLRMSYYLKFYTFLDYGWSISYHKFIPFCIFTYDSIFYLYFEYHR